MISTRRLDVLESPLDREIAAQERHIAYLVYVYPNFEESVFGKDVEEVGAKGRARLVR